MKKYKINKQNVTKLSGILLLVCLFIISFVFFQNMTKKDYTYEDVNPIDTLPPSFYNLDNLILDNQIMTYDDENYTSSFGIDVSQHQKEIDWDKVKNSGVEFVYIRLGYRGYQSGLLNIDQYFEDNYSGAKAAGLKIGVYFFSQAINTDEAIDEAYFVSEHIKNKDIDLPVVYDLEEIANEVDRVDDIDEYQRSENAIAFCDKITSLGYKPMIYTNLDWANNYYDLSRIMNYDLWMAQYAEKPEFQYEFKIWQYTPKGTIDGITEEVDLNIMFIEK